MTDNDLIPLLPVAELRLSRLVCVRKSRKLKGFAAVEILFVENKLGIVKNIWLLLYFKIVELKFNQLIDFRWIVSGGIINMSSINEHKLLYEKYLIKFLGRKPRLRKIRKPN